MILFGNGHGLIVRFVAVPLAVIVQLVNFVLVGNSAYVLLRACYLQAMSTLVGWFASRARKPRPGIPEQANSPPKREKKKNLTRNPYQYP